MTISGVEIETDCVEVVSCVVASKSGATTSSWWLSTFGFEEAESEDTGASVGHSDPLGEGTARLGQWPLWEGRQSMHGIPDLTHEQALHRPLPLHRQHTGIFVAQRQQCGKFCNHCMSSPETYLTQTYSVKVVIIELLSWLLCQS